MTQAIMTRYHGPGNVRGSRVSATAAAGKVTIRWDHALNPAGNHGEAAMALAMKYGWTGRYVAGGFWNGDMAWVCADDPGHDGEFTVKAGTRRC